MYLQKTFFLLLTLLPSLGYTQNAGSAININGSEVRVADDPVGSLDPAENHTIELWFKANEVQTDQKLYNKIGPDFRSGYILGIEDGEFKYELFNLNGVKQELIAGTALAGQWMHLAVTYAKGGKITMYVNGAKVADLDDDDTVIGRNSNNLIIGTSSWDIGALDFAGQIDEVRFWHGTLSEQTIGNWMTRNVDFPAHPNSVQLQLYHKYDSGSGNVIIDHSNQTTNTGVLTIDSWSVSTVPFQGTQSFATTGQDLSGIWVGRNEFTVDKLTISGVGLTGDQSVVLESNVETMANSVCGHPVPASIESVSCIFWRAISQEDATAEFRFELSGFNLTRQNIFLLESNDVNDFTEGNIYEGTLENGVFTVDSVVVNSDAAQFYTVGFAAWPVSVRDLSEQGISVQVSPNPSNGVFQLSIGTEQAEHLNLRITDYLGRVFIERPLSTVQALYQEEFNISSLPKGLYLVSVSNANGVTTQRLVHR